MLNRAISKEGKAGDLSIGSKQPYFFFFWREIGLGEGFSFSNHIFIFNKI